MNPKNYKFAPEFRGSHHHAWKGDEVSRRTLHIWVDNLKGKPRYCEHCESTTEKRYEWANVSGEYRRDLTDFIRLCVSCHRVYDRDRFGIRAQLKDEDKITHCLRGHEYTPENTRITRSCRTCSRLRSRKLV